jgi:rhodanese-related sulfurtransferase
MTNTQIQQLDPQQAYQYLEDNPDAVLLDVRSTVEFTHVGHPPGAYHVPWAEGGAAWAPNPNFVGHVRARLSDREGPPENRPILALCRSGGRSQAAAEALAKAGFKHLFNICEGFEGDLDGDRHRNTVNGWRARGLPWEQT